MTSWHYCYYPEDASDYAAIYTASVATWRYDSTTDQFTLLNGSITLIELRPVDTLARIYCTQEILEPVNSIEISRPWKVGVVTKCWGVVCNMLITSARMHTLI